MTARFLALLAMLTALPAVARDQPAPAATPAPAPPVAKGFDAFALVKTRNVFDPNRRAMRTETTTENRTSRTTRPSYFMLTGTMVADGRTLAFFSGSRTEFSKVIPAGESVAGYKVLVITPAQVELEHGGKSLTMGVGHRLQIDGMTDEVAASEPGSAPAPGVVPPPGAADPNAPSAPASAAPAAGGDKAEIMRRLMERRQKEMSK